MPKLNKSILFQNVNTLDTFFYKVEKLKKFIESSYAL